MTKHQARLAARRILFDNARIVWPAGGETYVHPYTREAITYNQLVREIHAGRRDPQWGAQVKADGEKTENPE